MKLNRILPSIAASLVCCTPIFADPLPKFAQLHIQISNQTGVNCQAKQPAILNHGKYDGSAPPESMLVNDNKAFDMDQAYLLGIAVYGPSVTLSYQCGNNYITFDVNKSLSWFFGSDPYAVTKDSKGLEIRQTVTGSSMIWDNEAQIVVKIVPAGYSQPA